MLMDLTAEFVKRLNSAIGELDVENKDHRMLIDRMMEKLSVVMKDCEASEDAVSSIISKIEESTRECKDIVYVRRDESISAVLSRDVAKPCVGPVNKLAITCNCLFDTFGEFEASKGYTVIDTEKALRALDSQLSHVILGVFEHSYRSFDVFTCFLGLYLPNGNMHIIDAIKFREIIPQLRLLTCEVKKVITSERGVECLIRDFGSLGCYQNFNTPEKNVFIDWRIRPLNDVLCCIICNDLIDAAEKLNMGLPTERHELQPTNEVEDFMEAFEISEAQRVLVEDLIKLRAYLAKKNDESPQFVMTDIQLYKVILNMPEDMEEFAALLTRMSSILRLHVSDFLIILNQKSKVFSLERLKSKTPPVSEEVVESPVPCEDDLFSNSKYRSFGDAEESGDERMNAA